MIYTALSYLYSVKLFAVQRWIICTTLNDLYYIEWFVLRWMIYTTLSDFLLPRNICATSNDLYSVERFVLTWMVWSAKYDFYNVESFGLRWIVEYRLFNKCQMCLFEKYCKIFYTNLWVDFFLIWKYQEEIFIDSTPETGDKDISLTKFP